MIILWITTVVTLTIVSRCKSDYHIPSDNIRPVNCRSYRGIDLCINARCQTVAPPNVTSCLCVHGTVPNPLSPLECMDLNECEYNGDVCGAGQYGRCINLVGDYRCDCDIRYYRVAPGGRYCQEFNRGYNHWPYWWYYLLMDSDVSGSNSMDIH